MALDGKFALVTGGSRGIGRGIALKLASERVKVAVHSYQNEKAAKDTLAGIRRAGSEGILVQAPVENGNRLPGHRLPGGRPSRSQADDRRGPHHRHHLGTGRTDWRVAALGCHGSRQGCARDAGAVLRRDPRGPGDYGKCGEPRLTEDSVLNSLPPQAQVAIRDWHTHGWTPMRRLGTPEDVGNVVALLCQKDAGWITGQLIVADGGASLMNSEVPLALQLG